MLDEDIQYIGTRPSQSSFDYDPFLHSPQIVTGITLRVEKSADDPPCVLTFRRSTSSVVHIGRRPSNEERVQSDIQGAMFRCAVVSRKHAKIAFSDSGHAYLIDMNSHHGTHIRKPGEAISRMLKPETPTRLADGDVLTFGKSVGRHNEYVRPVVARVELIHKPPSESSFTPMTPVKAITHVDSTKPSPPRSNSGRYGVYVPNSPSSDNFSSGLSEHDSDIEEIPASGPNALPLLPRGNRSHSEPESPLGRAFEALKRLLPPAHIPGAPPVPDSQPAESIASSPRWDGSALVSDIPPRYHSPLYSPRSPACSYEPRSRRASPSYSNEFLGPSIHSPSFFEPNDSLFPGPASHSINVLEEHERPSPVISRSTSPMDLASPSPVPALRSLSPEEPAREEPSVIGAWPGSRSSSPQRLHSPAPIQAAIHGNETTPVESAPPSIQKAMSLDSICSEPHFQAVENAAVPRDNSVGVASPEPVSDVRTAKETTEDVSELQASLKRLQSEVSKLQAHRRKYKARFNTNVHLISDKLSDLDERVSDVNAQYMMLLDSVDSAVEVDLPDLQAQIDALRDQVETLPTMTTEPLLHERSDVKASIETLHELVVEMRNLRESTQEQMSAELNAVRAARDAALAKIAAQVEAQTLVLPTPAPCVVSLKRKRVEDEGDAKKDAGRELVLRAPENEDGGGAGVSGTADVMMADATTLANTRSITSTAELCHHHDVHVVPPPPKRARTIATVAVQTATAVTVGAIATWSALAFS
ncbi:hypothetical protein D9615_008200 [Tricholomella constricta]|uniref:FHA domain-containing protein n=1 Tax=Tricholomella constricta TaxID=117010 RepID=A0A8H5H333_9AGAR|nr:hypothetical protein D9615_008200 [Tricholomella constricta]